MCELCKLLYRIIPLKIFQSYLIEKHFSRCPRCQKEMEIDRDLKKIVAVPNWVKEAESLWPQIKSRLHSLKTEMPETKRKAEFLRPKKWQWAMAGLALALVIGINVFVHQIFKEKAPVEDTSLAKEKPRVVINFAQIKGKKATPFIYQTPTTSFIFFTKAKNSGG